MTLTPTLARLKTPGWKSLFFGRLSGRAAKLAANPARLLGQVRRATRLARTHRDAFGNNYGHLRALLRMVRATARGRYRPSTMTIVSAVAVILYILSPIDLIPDFILGVGFLDDAAFFMWMLKKLGGELDRFVQWERAGAPAARQPANLLLPAAL
jgi:uncharacterized membrane protein YkvA (DUF1232 family)